MKLKISPTIANEWSVRCIGDVIPALAEVDLAQPTIEVDAMVAAEIAADCKFYLDPWGPETTVGERSAYRALLKQIEGAQRTLTES